MCLLIVLSRTRHDLPLVVAANRDERLDRPQTAMTVLREAAPRVLGGRDEQAGGTWFALNEAGVFAGLTNRPPTDRAYPAKRSRGELPLALAAHWSAPEAAESFVARFSPADYNPAWLLVGDRQALFAVDMTGTSSPTVTPLPPGLHILENHPPGTETPKVARVRSLLAAIEALPPDALVRRLEAVLADHETPGTGERPSLNAACVHAEGYGTRWSGIVTVPGDPDGPPTFRYADGPPCRAPFVDAPRLTPHGSVVRGSKGGG